MKTSPLWPPIIKRMGVSHFISYSANAWRQAPQGGTGIFIG